MFKKIFFITLMMVFLISSTASAVFIYGFGESDDGATVTVSYNDETYWLNIGDKINGFNFEGITNKQLLFTKNDNQYLVNTGGVLGDDSPLSETTSSSSSKTFTGRDRGNAGPVDVPDGSTVEWSVSEPDSDVEVAFQIFSDLDVIANTTAPAEGSFYIQEGANDVVFDVNAYGGVEWTIEIVD